MPETAVAHYEKALAIKIEFNDQYSQASTYHNLGIVAQEQQQWETAVAHYEKALALKIEFNDRYSQGSTLNQLGMVAERQELWGEAANYYLQAVEIAVAFQDEYRIQTRTQNLANVWQANQTQSATHLEGASHLSAVETIPTRLAAALNISPAEAEALLNDQAGGN